MKLSNTIFVSPKYIEEKERQIADLSKTIERLQEQINEANECIKDKYLFTCSACSLVGSCMSCGNKYFGRYIKKWGVK